MEIKICCPGCRRNFTLRTSNPASLNGASFKCPKCATSTPFRKLLTQTAGGMATPPPVRGGMQNPGMSPGTNLGGPRQGGIPAGGHTQVHTTPVSEFSLVVKSSGRRFPLTPGEHVLGRDSADSRASIRLAPDPYMSRAHAMVSVVPSAGGAIRVSITGMNSTNVVYVNNSRLYPGSTLELHPGDEILLGMTTVRFVTR